MANVIGVLCTPRKSGFTAKLLNQALEGAASVEGIQTQLLVPSEFHFTPCYSCYDCIRNEGHTCLLPDDFGKKGEGILFNKVSEANGIILADPVHWYGESAIAHTFIERTYPLVWSGKMNGTPFASISFAANEGGHISSNRNLCRFAFGCRFRYVGGLPIHAVDFSKGLKKARAIGVRLGKAALRDEKGRRPMSDKELWLEYTNKPWNPLDMFIENFCEGVFQWKGSLLERAIRSNVLRDSEARNLLEKAGTELRSSVQAYKKSNRKETMNQMVSCVNFWALATWRAFLESDIKSSYPEAVHSIKGE